MFFAKKIKKVKKNTKFKMIVSTEAIIIKSVKYGDSSKLVTAYSRDYGKINLMAKGARKSKNKFGSCLEPLSNSYLSFYKKRNRDLYLLSSAEPERSLRKIRDSFDRLSVGMIMAESIIKGMQMEESSEDFYDMLIELLVSLNKEEVNAYVVMIDYLLRYIHYLGFSLDLAGLGRGLQEYGEEVLLIIETGEFTRMRISGKFFRLEKFMAEKIYKIYVYGEESYRDIDISEVEAKMFLKLVMNYLTYHMDRVYSFNTYRMLGE